ncbi:MAG: fused response regulator/phosphatase [Candidatus Tectomicrobia bacterium]
MWVETDKRTSEDVSPAQEVGVGERPLRLLIVDDDLTNRLVLNAMLVKEGHTVLTAADGQEALEVFDREQPDMVLMDVMMPVMDGYEATRQIKARTGERFVPVIFLTALHDETALVECVACGGDDFLTKPYKRPILRAKVEALERVRRLYATLKTQKDELATHHTHIQQEQKVAEGVFSNIVHAGCLDMPHIKYLLSPMAIFNGDLLLAAPKPSGGLHIMVGDFTGHGLPAALGAIPLSDIFYDMTAKGYEISDIVAAINQKLKAAMPTGVFCAACLLEFDPAYSTLTIWNGGIPEVLVYGRPGRKPKSLASQHLPLGVVGNDRLDRGVEIVNLAPGDRVYAYTDGVIETCNPDGEMFAQQRLDSYFVRNLHPDRLFDEIRAGLSAFRAGRSQSDDVTLVEITCDAVVANHRSTYSTAYQHTMSPSHWQMVLELGPDTLRRVDPLPQIIQMLMEMQGLHQHRECLYTVLAELFSNALDHGLLGLDSGLKSSPERFAEYYTTREKRVVLQVKILSPFPSRPLVLEISDSIRQTGGFVS